MNAIIEPNLHPLIVHFVIAFLMTGPLLLLAVAFASPKAKWRPGALVAGDWMLALGLVASLFAIAAGLQAYYSVAHDGPSHAAMTDHRNWALVTITVFFVVGFLRYRMRGSAPSILLAVALLIPVGLLGVTGWKGGHLVYRYGLGVESLPEVSGQGHDHEHATGQEHGNAPAALHDSDETENHQDAGSDSHRPPEEPAEIDATEQESKDSHSGHDH